MNNYVFTLYNNYLTLLLAIFSDDFMHDTDVTLCDAKFIVNNKIDNSWEIKQTHSLPHNRAKQCTSAMTKKR